MTKTPFETKVGAVDVIKGHQPSPQPQTYGHQPPAGVTIPAPPPSQGSAVAPPKK